MKTFYKILLGWFILVLPFSQKLTAQSSPPCTNLSLYTSYSTGDITSGINYIGSDVDIISSTSFNDAEILMEHGTTITVHYGGILFIKGCHLYCCQNMWKGIVVEDGGQLFIDGGSQYDNSLIEDAEIAVSVQYSDYKDVFPNNALTVNSTVFNRNRIGIDLGNSNYIEYNQTPTTIVFYPVSIKNSIFTCRDIFFHQATNTAWFNYEDFKNTTLTLSPLSAYPATPETNRSPYIEETNYSSINSDAYLKDGSGEKSAIGINAYSNKSSNGTYKIGDENNTSTSNNVTIFDNQTIGVKLNSTDVKFENCTFQNTPTANPDVETYGVLAEHYDEGNFYIDTRAASTKPKNAFFDCKHGITCNFYTHMFLENMIIRSSKTADLASVEEGLEGITMRISSFGTQDGYGNETYANSNELNNIAYPISLTYDDYPWWANSSTGSGTSFTPDNIIEVNKNQIYLHYGSSVSTALSGYFTEVGINLNQIISTTPASSSPPPLRCIQNIIEGATHSIDISNWTDKNIRVLNNYIDLNAYYVNSSIDGTGIVINGCTPYDRSGNYVYRNSLHSSYVNPYVDYANSTMKGIVLNNGSDFWVRCNYVWHAFKNLVSFDGFYTNTYFYNNQLAGDRIHGNNQGLVLQPSTIIGQQGYSGLSCGNIYNIVPTIPGNFWPSGTYKTYCINAHADYSKMYVTLGNATYDPSVGGYSGGTGISYIPYGSSGTLYSGSSNNYSCPAVYSREVYDDEGNLIGILPDSTIINENEIPINDDSLQNQKIEEAEQFAIGNYHRQQSSTTSDLRKYVSQMQLYQSLQYNTALLVKHPILSQFVQQNKSGSFGLIDSITRLIVKGDTFSALQQLAAWSKVNQVDENYAKFLSWNVKRIQHQKIDLTDVEALAIGCPQTDGNVVFAAQNLYNLLTNGHRRFDTHCDVDTTTRFSKRNIANENSELSISIYPNPATNAISIKAPNIISIEVLTADGKKIAAQKVSSFIITINLTSQSPGLYLIKCIDKEGMIITKKFIKVSK